MWQSTRWRGEAAWASTCGAVRAIVTEARQRLIYLGAADGTQNLLNAPLPHTPAEDPWANQGGHRFWLGPQKKWAWPPVADWEYSAAQTVQLEHDCLVLQQPRRNPAYPALTREYAWVDHQLRCTARWTDPQGDFFGMHVVAVDVPLAGSAQLVRGREVPLGLVHVQIDHTATEGFLPHPAIALVRDRAIVRSGEKLLKVGFFNQPLTVDRAASWRLSILPGPHAGTVGPLPDHGYLSQIWVGGPEYDFAELEQLTPYLRSDGSTPCASTIFLAALPPSAG
jgi:hypothetical protein